MLPPSSITKIELVRILFLFSYQTKVRILVPTDKK